MKKSYFIAFSGASNSYKTTTINNIKNILGDNAIILDEVIRKKENFSIDDVRSNPDKYVDFQIEVISEKIKQEQAIFKYSESAVVLIDRSMVDSLMYYLLYVDKNNLSNESLKKYSEFYEFLIERVNEHVNNVYDKIFFLPPQKPNLDDQFRTKKLNYFQSMEAEVILRLSQSYLYDHNKLIIYDQLAKKKFNFSDVYVHLKDHLSKEFFQVYQSYKKQIEEKDYILDNIVMNSIESALLIDNLEMSSTSLYLTAGLFTEEQQCVDFTKQLFQKIKTLKVKESYENSLCYPTGFIRKNIPMVIGEAPGTKGRGLRKNFLKPSFFFTQTSHLLKTSLFSQDRCCYITNAIKHAVEENKSTKQDFENSFEILKEEIEFIQPGEIFVLGNKTYDFLSENLTNKLFKLCKKVPHPAYEIRNGRTSSLFYSKYF